MADINYLSFTGDAAGNIWRNGQPIFTADQPGMRVWYEHSGNPDNPALYADANKFSGCRRLRVVFTTAVDGGNEDVIDINNECEDLEVVYEAPPLIRGRYFATIKGGCRRVFVKAPSVGGRGKYCEIEFGNYSGQSRQETHHIVVQVEAGQDLRYVVGNADKNTIGFVGPCAFVERPLWSLLVKIYVKVKNIFYPPKK